MVVNPLNVILLLVLGSSSIAYLLIGLFVVFFGKRMEINIVQASDVANTFTVYLPTYNEENAISRKLDDLLQQTAFENLEGEVLIYDCSTDKTREILKDYCSREQRIRMIEQSTRIGMARTFNEAIREARGAIFVKTDCDSVAISEVALEKLIQSLHTEAMVGAVTGVCVNVRREGAFRGLMTRLQVAESNVDSTLVAHSSSFIAIKKEALTPVNPESMAEDTEEFLRKKAWL